METKSSCRSVKLQKCYSHCENGVATIQHSSSFNGNRDIKWCGVFELLEAAWMFEIIGRHLSPWVNGCVIQVGDNLQMLSPSLAPLFSSRGPTDFLSSCVGVIWVRRWCPWEDLSSHGAARGRERRKKNNHFQSKIRL